MSYTIEDLEHAFRELGIEKNQSLMVHSSLSAIGNVNGGASTVISALLNVLGDGGTLIMPAFRKSISLPGLTNEVPRELIEKARAITPPYEKDLTPSGMGLITETFRSWPGTLRSDHPTSSVIANGKMAEEIVSSHPPAWATGRNSPFEKLHSMDAQHLLLGVGFNRLTMLHYAETNLAIGRRKTRLVPVGEEVVAYPDTGDDGDTYFGMIGDKAVEAGIVQAGLVGAAQCYLMSSRAIVSLAQSFLLKVL